ncbi:MAG: sulfotransferase [Candidatus Woesearchaeota archaeon]
MLASTLNLNEYIIIPRETDFIIPTAFIIDRVKDPCVGRMLISKLITSTQDFKHSIGVYLKPSEVEKLIKSTDYRLCDILKSIYNEIARKVKALVAGDKSPNDINFARILIKNGLPHSDIKIIHIVRDIRGVIMSLKRMPWADPDIEKWFPRLWSFSNLYIYSLYRNNPGKYLFIKYEELVDRPEEILHKVTDFLSVPFQDKMLDPSGRGKGYEGFKEHENLSYPFLREKKDSWKKNISKELKLLCESQAEEALREFGYLGPYE